MKQNTLKNSFISDISKKYYPLNQKISLLSVRINIINLIKEDYPQIDESMYIAIEELDQYRKKYIDLIIKDQIENITLLEKEVIEKIQNKEFISEDIDKEADSNLTFGQRIADKVASFGGSWTFIIFFMGFIVVWILLNVSALLFKSFDPFPFILLNLLLSCLAAIQAPVIMMSQNRVESRDRVRAKEDYKVNLKAEIEIQALHEKVDFMIVQQQQKMFELQDMQVEMLKEIRHEINKGY